MSLKAAKCSECGASLKVDITKERGFCPNCGTEFITEKIINQNVTNVEKQTNIYIGENPLENEIKQCKVLLMCLKNKDINNLSQRALNILELNPENEIAQLVYDCDFNLIINNTANISFINFNLLPITNFFQKNSGKVDIEFSKLMLNLIKEKYPDNFRTEDCVNSIFDNVENLEGKDDEVKSFFRGSDGFPLLETNIEILNKFLSQSRLGGFGTFLLTNNEYLAADMAEMKSEIKKLKTLLTDYKKELESIIKNRYNQTDRLTQEDKNLYEIRQQQFKELINCANKKPMTKEDKVGLGVFIGIMSILLIIVTIFSLI